MTVRPVRVVRKALVDKGMTADSTTHHVLLRKKLEGVTTVITKISHSHSEVGDTMAGLMARQCRLTQSQFWQLIDCTLDEDGWNALIRQSVTG